VRQGLFDKLMIFRGEAMASSLSFLLRWFMMGLTLIIRSKLKARGRSDIDKMLRKEGWGQTMTEEQADRAEFIERQLYKNGVKRPTHLSAHQIDKAKI
jgi:hypothetical protein